MLALNSRFGVYLRCILNISWTDHVLYVEVLRRTRMDDMHTSNEKAPVAWTRAREQQAPRTATLSGSQTVSLTLMHCGISALERLQQDKVKWRWALHQGTVAVEAS